MELNEQVIELLKKRNYHISFAESCTGGLCCARLVNVASISTVLDMSFVTYADEAKVELLGVNADTIKQYGVVSEEVAYQMAKGVCEKAGSEVGVGITGIAGPTGATATKPIGMVCFGFCINNEVKTFTKYFGEIGRNRVRDESVNFVYETLLELL